MCRFNSMFFFQQPILENFDWYWRVEVSLLSRRVELVALGPLADAVSRPCSPASSTGATSTTTLSSLCVVYRPCSYSLSPNRS